jgi:hypothetical protein
MGKTIVTVQGEDFLINGKKTYSELPESKDCVHGLLMNARFIQGIFDDKTDSGRFNRFGKIFDPDKNTYDLIKSLSEWYKFGLRAFTVGLQGGGPCFTFDNNTINNNPFSDDGKKIDPDYLKRMDRLIRASDDLGMVVIVSYFYPGQIKRLKDGRTIANAIRSASRFLKENKYTNVIIEICNEMDVDDAHPIIHQPESMGILIEMAKEESGGMLVGCSCSGGTSFKEVSEASDIILIHGNGCTRQGLYNLIEKVREQSPGKPVICNEDSQAISQLNVAYNTHTSWGYYNNITKQEPPADWSITKGEDQYFAYRMAKGIGIKVDKISFEDQFYLQGLDFNYNQKYWLRVASLYPELIDYVEFYCNDKKVYTCYDEPYTLFFQSNWFQNPWLAINNNENWKIVIFLRDGRVLERLGKTK